MHSRVCSNCGVQSIPNDVNCRHCGAPLQPQYSVTAEPPSPQPGIVLADGYVLPAPPNPTGAGAGAWQDGSTMVMNRDAVLPNRCVKCNQPTGPLMKRTLTWHHPAIYLLIFVALLVYLVVALILRQTAVVYVGLCEEHIAKRKRDIAITLLAVFLGIGLLIVAIGLEEGLYALIGGLVLLAGTIYGIVTIRVVTPSKIDKRFIWMRGVNKDYLSQLPQWPGMV